MKKYLFTAAVLVIASIFTSCEPEVVAETTLPATEEETTKLTPENGEETPQNKDDKEQETSTEENSDKQSNQKINHGFNLEYTQPELPDNVSEDLFAGYKFELSEWSSDDKERIQSYDFGTDGTYTQTIITTHTDSEGAKYERTTKKYSDIHTMLQIKLFTVHYNIDRDSYEQTRFTIINIKEDTIIANYGSKEYKFKYRESCENGVIELSLEAADEITKNDLQLEGKTIELKSDENLQRYLLSLLIS